MAVCYRLPLMPRNEPQVSVVIAVRDAEQYIGRTLLSALAQTLTEIEIVVVNDGSTDGTVAVIEALAEGDDRVRLFSIPPTGVGHARNFAVDEARGEFIAVLDGDDLWHPSKLELQVAAIRAGGEDTAAVGCLPVRIDLDDRILAGLTPFGLPTLRDLDGYALLPLLCSPFLWCSSLPLFRRSSFLEVGGYDNTLPMNEDFKIAVRLAERFPFAFVPEFLVGYRTHPGSRSSDPEVNKQADIAVFDELARRNPWIPARVLRWARARCRVFASARFLGRGDHLAALRHGARAVLDDPAVLLEPDALPAVLALVSGRSSLHAASPLKFPGDLDRFLSERPVDVFPGHRWFERVGWRRHVSMQRIESAHHAAVRVEQRW
jgi:glycosyltransferase involved in cell wall biosynthesis